MDLFVFQIMDYSRGRIWSLISWSPPKALWEILVGQEDESILLVLDRRRDVICLLRNPSFGAEVKPTLIRDVLLY